MPTDIAININQDVYQDDTNDLATVSGRENTKQSVAIMALDRTERFVGENISPRAVNELRGAVRSALLRDPEVETVIDVRIQEYDSESDEIRLHAKVEPIDDLTVVL